MLHPGKSRCVISPDFQNIARRNRRDRTKAPHTNPEINYDGKKLHRVDVETVVVLILFLDWAKFWRANVKPEGKEIRMHDAPHKTKFCTPTAQTAIAGVRIDMMSRCTRNDEADGASPERMPFGFLKSDLKTPKILKAGRVEVNTAVAPEPTLLEFGDVELAGQLTADRGHDVHAPWGEKSGRLNFAKEFSSKSGGDGGTGRVKDCLDTSGKVNALL